MKIKRTLVKIVIKFDQLRLTKTVGHVDPAYRTGAQNMAATTTELTLPRPTPICTVIPCLILSILFSD